MQKAIQGNIKAYTKANMLDLVQYFIQSQSHELYNINRFYGTHRADPVTECNITVQLVQAYSAIHTDNFTPEQLVTMLEQTGLIRSMARATDGEPLNTKGLYQKYLRYFNNDLIIAGKLFKNAWTIFCNMGLYEYYWAEHRK